MVTKSVRTSYVALEKVLQSTEIMNEINGYETSMTFFKKNSVKKKKVVFLHKTYELK